MADISMCSDSECVNRSECHRYCAVPSPIQAYAEFPRVQGEYQCEYFVPRRAGDRNSDDVDRGCVTTKPQRRLQMDCPMDFMIDCNLRARRVDNPTAKDRDHAARIILRVSSIMQCTVADLAEHFSKSMQ